MILLRSILQLVGDSHISLNEAIKSLIDSYYSTKPKKEWIDSEK
jgi:hypothetical protein